MKTRGVLLGLVLSGEDLSEANLKAWVQSLLYDQGGDQVCVETHTVTVSRYLTDDGVKLPATDG